MPLVSMSPVPGTMLAHNVVVILSLSRVQLFAVPWIAAYQVFLSFTISQTLLKFMSTDSVMLSNCFNLYPPTSPVLNLSHRQGFFQRVDYSHQVAKVLEL